MLLDGNLSIPQEGETPVTVTLCLYEELVDSVNPGDRVEISGIYRAQAQQVQESQRCRNSSSHGTNTVEPEESQSTQCLSHIHGRAAHPSLREGKAAGGEISH